MNWLGLYTFILREVSRMFRVVVQTLVSPWISALLYILIFGKVVGSRIQSIAGVPYINFVLPGILMMNLISSAFAHTSSSLYFHRFTRQIEELLTAPFSYIEMIIGYVAGGIVRGLVVGLGIYFIAIFFGAANVAHFFLFIAYTVSVALIFALLGLLVGLWAKGFEQLSVLNVFVIMPLSFVGGVFNSLSMLPPFGQTIAKLNPFFYFIDGLRYAMIGIREGSAGIGWAVILGSIAIFGTLVWYLFKIGYRMRV